MKLSILCPCYNEEKTVEKVITELKKLPIEKEIIVVDDGSTDKSFDILNPIRAIKLYSHQKNKGKGAAMKTGIKHATGDIISPFDLDSEYSPIDLIKCMQPIIDGKAEVVYGSRRLNKENTQHSGLSFYIGGIGLTWITNLLYGSRITDEPTCLKLAGKELYDSLDIQGNDFRWETEMTGKILKRGIKIHEVPINYYPRGKKDGKKMRSLI